MKEGYGSHMSTLYISFLELVMNQWCQESECGEAGCDLLKEAGVGEADVRIKEHLRKGRCRGETFTLDV